MRLLAVARVGPGGWGRQRCPRGGAPAPGRPAARRVAEKAGASWVPFQEMFDSAVDDAPANYWAGDGVHPSMAGHMKMAIAWLEALGS